MTLYVCFCLNIPYLLCCLYCYFLGINSQTLLLSRVPEGILCNTHIFPVKHITTLLDSETINISLALCFEATVNSKSHKENDGELGTTQAVKRACVT